MTDLPASSYSFLETHILRNVSRLAKIEPPIHVEYKRSWKIKYFKSKIGFLCFKNSFDQESRLIVIFKQYVRKYLDREFQKIQNAMLFK